jgi:WD40 repeat protein
MRVAYIGWFAFAVVTASTGCGDRVLVGEQAPSGLGSGATPPGTAPVNQGPIPPGPSAEPMPGTPPPGCALSSPPQFVPAPSDIGTGVFSLAYSPDGQTVAGGFDAPQPNVRLWNVADWTVLRDIAGHAGSPGSDAPATYGVAFSPDGRILATGGMNIVPPVNSSRSWTGLETVKLWDVSSGNLLRVIPAQPAVWVSGLAFSPDGTQLVTSAGSIQIWRVADGALLVSIPNSGNVYNVRFSPDGTRVVAQGVVALGGEAAVTIWRATDGLKLVTLSGQNDIVVDAAFSPDGSEIATGGYDYTVRLWDAATGAPRETLTGHSGYLQHVRWIDQDHLASNDWHGTVILWTRDSSGSFSSSCSLSTQSQSLGLDVSPDRTKLIASGGTAPGSNSRGFWIFPL